jgi:hypothetical protein
MKLRSIPKLASNYPSDTRSTADLEPNEIDSDDAYETSQSATIAEKKAVTKWRLLLIGLLATNAVFGLIIIGMLFAAVARSMPTFITRGNGETENLEFFTGNTRSPALIKFYAEKVVSGIYTWRSTLPEPGNPLDPGMVVEGGKKIPTTAYRYTLALEPEFANSYRKQLSELQSIVQGQNNAQTQTVYLVQQVGEPESLGAGRWKVKVAGTQLIVNSKNQVPTKLPINVELTLRAVPPPILSEVARKYEDVGIAKAAMMARAEGLEVTAITNLK